LAARATFTGARLFERAADRLGTNGQLLAAADSQGFDVFLTMDKALAAQQNLAHVRLAVVVLRAPSNRLEDTSPLMPQVLAVLPTLTAGQVVVVGP